MMGNIVRDTFERSVIVGALYFVAWGVMIVDEFVGYIDPVNVNVNVHEHDGLMSNNSKKYFTARSIGLPESSGESS